MSPGSGDSSSRSSSAASSDRASRGRAHLKYVKVAVNAGRVTYLTFSYSVPPDRDIAPGEVVHAPWGRRTLQGVVVDGPLDTPGYNPDEVRPLEPPVEGAPRISAERMALAAWLQDRYLTPPWEAHALFLPPGAGERPRTAVMRAAGAEAAPAALSAHQATVFEALDEQPVDVDELQARLRGAVPARSFDAALQALYRRGLAERRYYLERPRGRARVAEMVRLIAPAGEARGFAEQVEGRRSSRRARALRLLLGAGGRAPFDQVAREARGAPAVETLIEEGLLAREDDEVRLILDESEVEQMLRVLSRGPMESAVAGLLERLAERVERGEDPVLPLRGLAGEVGREARRAVERLAEVGLVRVEEVLERRDPLRDLQVIERPSPDLVGEQRQAAEAIRAGVDRRDGQGILLWGVTGSGKTEVYLDALRHAVQQGRRGIVLVPEIALTPQTVRRFSERFPGRVGVLHSGLSLGEAYDEWHAIQRGEYDVVIGSRSAIFAPQPDLGLIVIDEAHEWTYKQSDPAPRYDARTVAAELGRRCGAAVVYGSATPSVEQWFEAGTGDLLRLDLPRRMRLVTDPDGRSRLWPTVDRPEVELVDMRGAQALFSSTLVEALGEALDRDEQAILFLNRRGLAGFLLCTRGHSPMCSSCDVSLALHEGGRVICHQCGRSRRAPSRCSEVGCDLPLRPASAGTQRVEQEVRRHFPTARVLRWDRDTARSADQHQAILQQFVRREADVLVGTQMVAKGLDLPLVTLVGVVLADYTLREADFRSRERAFQLLVQVAGRAGRAERDGRVIVQTLQPDHPAIEAAVAHDIDRFYAEEIGWRAERGYPPFRRLVRMVFGHANAAYAREEAGRMAEELRTAAAGWPGIEVFGPTPPPVARVRGRHRWVVSVRGDDPAALLRDLDDLPPGWAVDVDPVVVS